MTEDINVEDLEADGTLSELKVEMERVRKRFNFDAIQLVASRMDGSGNTRCFTTGVGNRYARYGMMRVRCDDEQKALGDDDDG